MTLPAQLIPLKNYLAETFSFINSEIYLLTAAVAAVDAPGSELANDRATLQFKLPDAYATIQQYFLARLFISHIASFEVLVQDTVTLVAQKHPKKVGAVTFTLADVIDAEAQSVLIERAIQETLNKLMYKKPMAYLEELGHLLSINVERLKPLWLVFVEAKSRRDIGVHAAWRCNETYLRKLREAGIPTSARVGDSMVPPDGDVYYGDVARALSVLALEISTLVAAAHWPEVIADMPSR